ncbi:hypothetical protein XaraCFBP7407_22750, partial [Xanthomonas arboricola pv. arracaciae]
QQQFVFPQQHQRATPTRRPATTEVLRAAGAALGLVGAWLLAALCMLVVAGGWNANTGIACQCAEEMR